MPAPPSQEDSPACRIIDVTEERHPECLAVLRVGFGTVAAEFGLTRANTPSNPAFWEVAEVARVVAKPMHLIAVEQAGEIVGCAFVGPARTLPQTWELRHLAVVPGARHRGYGEGLVGEAARRSRQAGAAQLRIGIVAENRRLAAWYERLGFISEGMRSVPGLAFAVERLSLAL
ncbi:MAG: GNAT family N-acetyltransferase [Propionicimonas sp.]